MNKGSWLSGGSSSLQAAQPPQKIATASAAGPFATALSTTTAAFKTFLAGAALTLTLCIPAFADTPQQPAVAPAQSSTISIDQYRTRLSELQQLVAGCQQAMSPALCASDKVGPDVTLSLPEGPREIRFGWLRNLLDQVAYPDAARDDSEKPANAPAKTATRVTPQNSPSPPKHEAPTPDRNPPLSSPEDVIGISTTPNIFKRLDSARRRLEQDDRWAEQAQAGAAKSPTPATQNQSQAHRALTSILAAKEYRNAVAGPTIKDRILEKVANWIDTVLGELIKAGSKSRWIGLTAEMGFIALLCIALVWLLIRLERQGRLGSPSIGTGPGANAASARDWQLWLADAKQSADRSEWRDAIHYLYWASISRLESSGLWPADRARTPREYLALLSSESAKHADLITLTRTLEYSWYAGRPVAQSDYQKAEQLAASLGADLGHKPRKGVAAR